MNLQKLKILKEESYIKVQKTPILMMECQREENLKNCNCNYPGCSMAGVCCECVKYHPERNELPACYFDEKTEKTFDRSIENFLKSKV